MAWDSDPSPSEFQDWELLLADGMEPSQAARQVGLDRRGEGFNSGRGFTCSAFKRADVGRHGQALTISREARAFFADRTAEGWVMADDASPHLQALWLKRWNPAYRDKHEIAVTGVDGGVLEVQVVHDEAHAAELARRLAGLSAQLGGAVAGRAVGGGDPAELASLGPAQAA